ncbi:MAG TPA: sugar ABC transporter substrate-binding protein [Fimbriimonas sp.]
MTIRRRTAVVVALAALGACTPDPNAGKIQLRYMAWGNPEQMALEEEFCRRFNAQNPDIHVRFFRVPQSAYGNKAIVMFASRTAPDVVRIDHYNFPNLVRKDYFLDLTPYAKKDPTFRESDYFPSAVRECYYNGRLYGLNVLFGSVILYYNQAMVRDAGLEDPYALWKRGEWTWDRFRNYAQSMSRFDERQRPKRYGCTVPPFPLTTPVVWAFGGDLLTEDGTKSLVGQKGAVDAYQFLADLRWKHRCAPTPAQSANAAFTFESGKVGFEFNWMGMAPRYNQVIKGFDWDIVPLPKGPFGGRSIVKGNQLIVYRETKHPEAAWRFLRFMTSRGVETELYAVKRRCFPTRKDVAYSDDFLKPKTRPYQTDVFVKAVESAKELPIGPRWGEWTNAFNMEVDNLFSGRERDASVVMKRAEAKVNEVLADEEGF